MVGNVHGSAEVKFTPGRHNIWHDDRVQKDAVIVLGIDSADDQEQSEMKSPTMELMPELVKGDDDEALAQVPKDQN